MAAVFRLLVVVRVEVDIVEHNNVSCRQVDAESARARRQQEDEDVGLRVVSVDQFLSVKYMIKLKREQQNDVDGVVQTTSRQQAWSHLIAGSCVLGCPCTSR